MVQQCQNKVTTIPGARVFYWRWMVEEILNISVKFMILAVEICWIELLVGLCLRTLHSIISIDKRWKTAPMISPLNTSESAEVQRLFLLLMAEKKITSQSVGLSEKSPDNKNHSACALTPNTAVTGCYFAAGGEKKKHAHTHTILQSPTCMLLWEVQIGL